jgi:hypothetical protein
MPSKQEYDTYAAELTRRFEELTHWAIEHWPEKSFPLLPSDFSAGRREIGEIVGPKLSDGHSSRPSSDDNANDGQYRDMNPMPWP